SSAGIGIERLRESPPLPFGTLAWKDCEVCSVMNLARPFMLIPSRARRSWTRLAAARAGSLTALAIAALGQPAEEQEDANGGVKKKVIVEDDPKAKEAGPITAPDVRLDELVRGAEEATHPTIKDLFLRNAVPYDRLTGKTGSLRIKPIPLARGIRL